MKSHEYATAAVGTTLRFTIEGRVYAVIKTNHPDEPWYSTSRYDGIVPKRMSNEQVAAVMVRPSVENVELLHA